MTSTSSPESTRLTPTTPRIYPTSSPICALGTGWERGTSTPSVTATLLAPSSEEFLTTLLANELGTVVRQLQNSILTLIMETIEVSQPGGKGGVIHLDFFYNGYPVAESSVTQEGLDNLILQLRKFQTPARLESPVE